MYHKSALLLAALALAGCSAGDESSANQPAAAAIPTPAPPINPLALHSVEELVEEHGLRIGPEPDSDIVVVREGERIRVRLSPAFVAKLPKDSLLQLGIVEPDVTFTDAGYRSFMGKLHDYAHDHLEDHSQGHSH